VVGFFFLFIVLSVVVLELEFVLVLILVPSLFLVALLAFIDFSVLARVVFFADVLVLVLSVCADATPNASIAPNVKIAVFIM